MTITAGDGTDVRVHDEGSGPVVVLLHPGLDDGSRDHELAAILARRFRVLRLHRRQYRLDLDTLPCSVADEVDDVVAVVRSVGGPVVLYGHSDGGVVALEALAAAPRAFSGAVVFEAPVAIGPPLGGEVVAEAKAALAAGRPGRAMALFFRRTVGLAPWQATLAGAAVAAVPKYRRLVPGQINSLAALDDLGVRLDTYARVTVPTVLLGGDRSPAHLAERLDALAAAMPTAERVVMPGRDHGADLKHPAEVAAVVEALADRVLRARDDR
ncbi:alpha/beta hydrolase [Umezawaea sp.]|uniref:alpha/beta fold hydrolase n=1 Tax=Umezawaea sp. TaxID=1955258 RepID=UPI002ED111CD